MYCIHKRIGFLNFFSNFYQKTIDKAKRMCYNKGAKGQREREIDKKSIVYERFLWTVSLYTVKSEKWRATPVHSFEDPINFIACCRAGHEIARISCTAAGSEQG